MATRLRSASIALSACALAIAAPLLFAAPASAATADDHLTVFSADGYTDVSEEDVELVNALSATGATVTTFDGGDGSAAAWTAVLADTDVLYFSEQEEDDIYAPAGTPVLSTEAADVVKAWITAGGTAYATGGYSHQVLFSFLTGIDYSDVWGDSEVSEWELVIDDPALAPTLPGANYSGGLAEFAEWTPEQSAPVTPIYYDADSGNLGVGSFAVGDGAIVFIAYDFFPDEFEIEQGIAGAWVSTLNALTEITLGAAVVVPPVVVAPVVTAPAAAAPVAVLAETGTEVAPSILAASGLLAIGLSLLIARRRSAARA